jgi:hypothetical protein
VSAFRNDENIWLDSDTCNSNNDLFPGQPPGPPEGQVVRIAQWFSKMVIATMKRDAIVSRLQFVMEDTRQFFGALTVHPETNEEWHVMNPFDDIYRLVFRLTMRMLGPSEIAENPKLLFQTLSIFERFDRYSGPYNVIFPWLPTRDYFGKMYLSFRLFWTFRSIVKQRERTGKKPADTIQYLLDAGSSIQEIATVSIKSLIPPTESPSVIDVTCSLRLHRSLLARSTAVS